MDNIKNVISTGITNEHEVFVNTDEDSFYADVTCILELGLDTFEQTKEEMLDTLKYMLENIND